MHGSNNPGLQQLPFDPTFFARQTALEQNHLKRKPQYVPLEHENQAGHGTESEEHNTGDSGSCKKLPPPMIEPIYQEITEPVTANHRSQRSWSGSRGNLVAQRVAVNKGSEGGGGHKRTYSGGDLLSVKRSGSTVVRSESRGGEHLPPLETSSTLDRLKWQSSSGRYPPPRHIDIQQYQGNDDESIPNSPSFYTQNPEAATMPESSKQHYSQSKHFFKDHLTNLDTSAPPPGGHNRVMNWMQHSTFWDSNQPRGGVAQVGRSVSMSQSVHSHLGRNVLPRVDSAAAVYNQSNQFKDHLYEDPDHLKSKMQRPGNVTGQNSRVLPRVSSLPRSVNPSLPYVTRELPSTKPGSTMYATDV